MNRERAPLRVRRANSSLRQTTHNQAMDSVTFDGQAFDDANSLRVCGESEASARHDDALCSPPLKGTLEDDMIQVVVDDHQMASFDVLDTTLSQANAPPSSIQVGYRSYAEGYAALGCARPAEAVTPYPALTPHQDTPSTRISNDVLYYLFVLANDDMPTAAVSISHVCKRWRTIAVMAPTLWTKITMVCVRGQQQHPWTMTRLKRSQCLPISFHLRAYRKMTAQELKVVVTRHAHRFRRLSILASNHRLTMALWPQFSQILPTLEHFEYRIIGDIRVHAQRDTPGPFHIPGASRDGAIEWAKWDTSTIASLTLNYIGSDVKLSVYDFRQIFTHCRHTLMHLELLGFAPMYDKENPVPQITLPVLESLSIGYIDNVIPFVELAHTPSLRSLTLRDIIQTPENFVYVPKRDWRFGAERTNVGRIYELMQGAPLTQLAIFGEQFGYTAEFREFLLALVGLKSLTLYASANTYYDTLFNVDTLLPSLSDLLITHVDSMRTLAPFFLRRMEAELPPLYKLTITNDGVSLIEAEELLKGVMSGCSSISAITDPILEIYNIIAEGERDIVIGGVVIV